MMENKDWYTERWKNKRALRNKALRKEKRELKPQETEKQDKHSLLLKVYDPAEAAEHGELGIVANLEYPAFSLLCKGTFISSSAKTKEQRIVLNQLAVGDNVIFTRPGQEILLHGITRRHSQLARLRVDASRISQAGAEEHVFAANVDVAVIVASTVQPTFHTRLVDRYLVLCQYGNVMPILCLTKIDLAPAPDLSMYRNADLPVIRISNKTHEGIGDIMQHIKGKRAVLVGNSGVGKSSLVNSLLNKERQSTKEVSRKSGKGRHETSSTSLHLLDDSTILIDTPGIRSLGLWRIDAGSLRLYYPEFLEFSRDCEFSDCTHSHEPRCAVKKAVENGLIPTERYDSYMRLLSEDQH